MNKPVSKLKFENIFELSFMDDFTTVILAEEEYGIDISKLQYENGDDFYCFSEKKSYTEKELYKRFNIEIAEYIGERK